MLFIVLYCWFYYVYKIFLVFFIVVESNEDELDIILKFVLVRLYIILWVEDLNMVCGILSIVDFFDVRIVFWRKVW